MKQNKTCKRKFLRLLQTLVVILMYSINVNAQNVMLAGWDVSTINAAQPQNLGPQNFPPSVVATNVTAGGLMRTVNVGSATGNSLSGFGGFGFCGTAADPIPNTLANVIANNAFLYFTMKANPGQSISLDSFTLYYYSAGVYGPRQVTLQYGIDSLNFTNIYTDILPANNTVIGNLKNFSLQLSGIAALQNVAAIHTIYFRLVPVYSGTATTILPISSSSAAAGVWTIYNSNTGTALNNGCDMFFKGTVSIGCNSVTAGTINSSAGNPICGSGSTSLSLTGTVPQNGVNYQWQTSANGTTGWANTGTNAATYATGNITTTTYYRCIVTCATGSVSDTTPVYTLTVNPFVIPAVTITATPGTTVAPGQSITFVANTTNAGSSPSYQWKKNGVNIASAPNSSVYTTNAFSTGDIFSCTVLSNAPCSNPNTATSNPLTVIVNPCMPPQTLTMWNLSAHGTMFHWSPVAGALGYEYLLDQSGANPGGNGTITTDTFYTAANYNDTWYFHVRTLCNNSNASPWIAIPVIFSPAGVDDISGNITSLLIYPNPNNGTFIIKATTTDKQVQVEVLNLLGQSIFQTTGTTMNGQFEATISLPDLSNGTYLLRLHTENGMSIARFTISK